MYKVILSPVDESKYMKSVTNATKFFAKTFSATVLAQYVINLISLEGPFFHDLSGALGMEPMVNLTEKMKEVLQEKGNTLINELCNELSKENIGCKKFIDTGIVANKIVERGKVADLIIIGKRGINEKYGKDYIGSTAEGVLRKSYNNILIVPNKFEKFSK